MKSTDRAIEALMVLYEIINVKEIGGFEKMLPLTIVLRAFCSCLLVLWKS